MASAMVRGSWGAAPVPGLEPRAGDFIVEKMRMSAWEGTRLETILKATGRDMIINTGAWTNMSVEHTARTAAEPARRPRTTRPSSPPARSPCTCCGR